MATKSNDYLLGRDFHASTRLYMQHWMWRRKFGFLLHPKIPVNEDQDIQIADVACGTGIWLIDLAKEIPKATLDGFDISTKQFPHRNWLPPQVRLHELNAMGPMPKDLLGRYDIVHVGLVVLLVSGGDPSILVNNLLSLLKPGGYLQWNEADIEHLPRIPAADDVPRTNCDELYTKIYAAVGRTGVQLDLRWVRELPKILSNHPDIDLLVADERHPVPDDLAQPASQAHLLSLGEMLQQLDTKTVEDMNLVELYHGAMYEMQQGMSVRMGQVLVVARKRQGVEGKECEDGQI
ncbi:hypothetical protein VP1G_07000 [Cytospora mali]|uniref:Methyltransferase type 12 domain-containing protein n=1 Tax=Cytospora mali TaxID=578113 RepID=A0A194V7A8_CYTMA|nr:hypothetical protein VP1G_07000 [Valsa mali var. pyri (nom. inval.)]